MTTVELSPALDAGAFAERILQRPLWDHQLDIARSPARYRVVCAGRQVGKSTVLSTLALFEAVTRRNVTVLLVSAGEVASRRLLEECTALALESALGGSVLDDSKSLLTFSNGSRIISVPASQRQIRGWPVDVLIMDEAGFIDPEIWRASEPAIIARPGSKVILTSTPWGDGAHFFRALWNRGMDRPDLNVAAWHWPSSVSPLVDDVLLAQIRDREPADYFKREFLAEWTDEAGAYFTEAEIMNAVADYEMTAPKDLQLPLAAGHFSQPYFAAAGVDWGYARDANALALVSVAEDLGLNRDVHGDDSVFFVPWIEVRHNWPYSEFIDRVVEVAATYQLKVIASEVNGVGQYPTDDLTRRLYEARRPGYVYRVVTDVRRKQSGFSKIKGLLQRRRLVLPRHPELLKQLRGLEFEQLATGNLRISVPDRAGHDDLAMALMQAVSSVYPPYARRNDGREEVRALEHASVALGDVVATQSGLRLPRRPLPILRSEDWIMQPEGNATGEQW